MDQYPFEFNITIIGMDVHDFIELLKSSGYENTSEVVLAQFEKQLNEGLDPKTYKS